MKTFKLSSFLLVYSTLATTLLIVLTGIVWTKGIGELSIAHLQTQHIDVREPDKTLRLAISNTATSPPIIIKGTSFLTEPHGAGLVFYNAEGTENGGLLFGGEKSPKSGKHSYGHLSFDAYEQDQTMSLDSVEDGTDKWTRLQIVDYPDYSIGTYLSYRESLNGLPPDQIRAKLRTWTQAHGRHVTRLSLGRGIGSDDDKDQSVLLSMNDTEGRPRLVLQVAQDGTPSIKLLDASGKVANELTGAAPSYH